MDYERQFLVMVDAAISLNELLNRMARLDGFVRRTRRSFDWQRNWIQVAQNEDHDAVRTREEDGFLFFKFRVEVSPLGDVSVEDQVACARRLHQSYRAEGYDAEICADFEALLDGPG